MNFVYIFFFFCAATNPFRSGRFLYRRYILTLRRYQLLLSIFCQRIVASPVLVFPETFLHTIFFRQIEFSEHFTSEVTPDFVRI